MDRSTAWANSARRRWTASTGLVLVTGLLGAACTGSTNSPAAGSSPDQPQVLTQASTRDFKASSEGRNLVFETLVRVDEEGNPIPHLAESWEVSDDDLTYTFTLRDDVSFHNGTPLTAEEAKFSIEFAANEGGFGAFVEGVEAVDDRTLRIELNRPYWRLLGDIGTEFDGKIFPPAAVEPVGDLDGTLENFIGTGPWLLESYQPDGQATLVRNDDYWDGPVQLDRMVWETIPDPLTQVLALRGGELDMAGATEHHSALPYSEMAQLSRDPDFQVEFKSYGRYQVIDFNTTRAPVDDPRVRQAFNLAVDREAMTETLFEGLADPVYHLSPTEDTWQWGPQEDIEGFRYEPDRARDLLDEAGWLQKGDGAVRTKDGQALAVGLLVPFGEANADVVALYVQSELGEIGVEVQVTTLESGAAFERRNAGDYDMFVHHSCGKATMGCLGPDGKYTTAYGAGLYATPELDATMQEAFTGADEAQRREAFDRVWTILHEQAVSMPLYDINKPVAYREAVDGFHFESTMFEVDLRDVTIQ